MNMTEKYFSADVPGSIMLFGEHAVLYGGVAVVAAVNRYIHIKLMPRADDKINIKSDRLGEFNASLSSIHSIKPFEFVLSAIEQYKQYLSMGFDLEIHSEFSENLGLGSSAAVTVGTLKILSEWLLLSKSPLELHCDAKTVIIKVQNGLGSGADAAASIFGGIISYQTGVSAKVKVLPSIPELALVYCGYKTPTREVISIVQEKQNQWPKLYEALYSAMNQCTQEAIIAFEASHFEKIGKLMNIYQGLMEALGVTTPEINILLAALRQQPQILGAKISGSGLGDCVWALGSLPPESFPQDQYQKKMGIQQLNVQVSENLR